MYYTTDKIYHIQLQARESGRERANETFNKLKEIYKGGYTHANKEACRPARPVNIDHK